MLISDNPWPLQRGFLSQYSTLKTYPISIIPFCSLIYPPFGKVYLSRYKKTTNYFRIFKFLNRELSYFVFVLYPRIFSVTKFYSVLPSDSFKDIHIVCNMDIMSPLYFGIFSNMSIQVDCKNFRTRSTRDVPSNLDSFTPTLLDDSVTTSIHYYYGICKMIRQTYLVGKGLKSLVVSWSFLCLMCSVLGLKDQII